ncbi:adaptor protein MecA [Anaerosporobacter faecicola]|uniref:adaptor protein MecA n=1 Tax=Anaerosporobacter faecicola TaxID=2718714 RepID=UPI00143C8C9B|nr:adaptor protein MecA [Anaerosporobacter faecicola]
MKIEKINDSQIRCTLNKEDLIDRELKISELAYGTEKAKELFRDMMQQASCEFGFEADDIPLMIEAIPISSECLILVITKVDDPDELDTRFSKFTADTDQSSSEPDADDEPYADEIINCFDQLNELLDDTMKDDKDTEDFIPLPKAIQSQKEEKTSEDTDVPKPQSSVTITTNMTKVFSFDCLDTVISVAEILVSMYKGVNTLYKNQMDSRYYLLITKSDHTPEEFNKVCNIITEYGKSEKTTYATADYYAEHFEVIVKDSAIQILSVM